MTLRNIKPISFFKAHLKEIIDTTAKEHIPVIITQNGEAAGVFVDVATWEEQQRALELIQLIATGEKSIKDNGLLEIDTVFKRLDKIYGQKK